MDKERAEQIAKHVAMQEKKYAQFHAWAEKQTDPPYYLKLNKYRLNEGNRWYDSERTEHTAQGFIAAMNLTT